ncbi:hypothetical protein DBO93_04040 [Colwellia sp. Arc7-D]|nr:hypothetical protein DBO93_04040 [Colwellia sp. Arc7-D]
MHADVTLFLQLYIDAKNCSDNHLKQAQYMVTLSINIVFSIDLNVEIKSVYFQQMKKNANLFKKVDA